MRKIALIYVLSILICCPLFASQIPAGQDAGSKIRDYIYEKKQKEDIKRITEPKPPSLDEVEIEALPDKRTSVYISKIIIQKDVYAKERVKEDELQKLIKEYENKTLSLEEMKVISAAIAQKSSNKKLKAYIPKQSFKDSLMYINLVLEEGL